MYDVYIYIYMSSGQNYVLNVMPCTNSGRPLSVLRISIFPEVSQMGVSDGIGIGPAPVGYEGFVQPRKGQGKAKLNYI